MIDTPHITQTASVLTAIIALKIPRSEIRSVMGPGLSEIKAAIAAQGIVSTGPWFTHHLTINPAIFDFEICVPVASPITATGRVTESKWPAMKVARTVFQGNYADLGSAWGAFDGWIAANGHAAAQDLWERYLKGPESSSDPADWQTELNRQLL